jgi:acyl carrier protein
MSAQAMNGEIEAKIQDFLMTSKDLAIRVNSLSVDQSLIGSGLIDSLAVLDLVEFLESEFAIQLDPEDLTGENFDTIQAMARLVRERRPAA